MRIAVYGREFNDSVLPYAREVFAVLASYDIQLLIYGKFHAFIQHKIELPDAIRVFNDHHELLSQADVLLSLGGDGTMLDTLSLVRNARIPIIGINFGRLGFLASINKSDIRKAIEALVNGEYTLDKRSVLNLESEHTLFENENFALNDITIHRRDNSAMMIIHAYMDGEFINSYWADGLIISTPTGSTAYSLSCGGPIIFPNAQSLVITPVAPHNLNVRPVIVPDHVTLTFEIDARSKKFLVSCDSRTETVSRSEKLTVSKADFEVNLIRLHNESYLTTLRNKLLWGIDTRNY